VGPRKLPRIATAEHIDPEVAGVAWDLEPLVDGRGEQGARAQLDEAAERAEGFAERHRGRVAQIASPDELAAAMHELVEIAELVSRAGSFAMLRFATDTADPARGALLAHV